MTKTDQLRAILAEPGAEVMPGVFDAMSARLVERAGFRASFMSGFAVAAARLAMPDTGLISYTEMANQGQNMCDAVSMPIIGDGDTGYGNAINTQRTVRLFEASGATAIQLEDQTFPKRCGHLKGKSLVPAGEMAGAGGHEPVGARGHLVSTERRRPDGDPVEQDLDADWRTVYMEASE